MTSLRQFAGNTTAALLSNPSIFRQEAFIAGEWVDAVARMAVVNPATDEVVGTVPMLGCEHTRSAILAAEAAQIEWRRITAKERARLLRAWYELVLANREDLALLMTIEQGKPLVESRGEIDYAAAFIEWFAEEGKRACGDTIPAHGRDKRIVVLKQPIGVAAAITPWNFPAAMVTRKVAPALAAGCAIIVKPSELTPFSALALCVLAERAGLPRGVLSMITGDAATIGAELTSNPIVRKVSFTGSTAIGKLLMAQCASTVKRLSLELGGNAPFIVFDDADVDAAVAGALYAKFRNAGQTCICANRIFVQRGVYERFATALARAVSALEVGDGQAPRTQLGPLIDRRAIAKVERHVTDAVAKGATITVGGRKLARAGSFFEPTVLTNVATDSLALSEETFGPVAPLVAFSTDEEVIELANGGDSGLAAYFYTRDIARAWRVAEALECGMVGINETEISTEVAPFGGWRESGLGREGSKCGLDEYLELKYLCWGGL